MTSRGSQDNRRELRSQPPLKKQGRLKRGRPKSSPASGSVELPRTAARRKRRNRIPFTFPTQTFIQVVTSPRWLSLVLLLVTLYLLNMLATRSDFYLRYIPVEGLVSIAPDEVVAASGLAGRHVFAADPNQAAAEIAKLPGIVSASVSLRWPNRITIAVEEDTPIAVWQTPEQTFWINDKGQLLPARIDVPGLLHIQAESTRGLIGSHFDQLTGADAEATDTDGDGEEVEEVEAADAAPLPKTVGAVPADILVGALLLQSLQPNERPVNTIFYHPSNGLSFQDDRGWQVFLGTGTDMEQKLTIYESIVSELQAQGITPQYVSVSNKEKPFYMATR